MRTSNVERILPVILIFVTTGSGIISFNGYQSILNESGESFLNTALASIIACISSILMWVAWNKLFEAAIRPMTAKAITAFLVIAVIVQFLIFGVSSVQGTHGFGHLIAKMVHARNEIAEAENFAESLQRYEKSVRAIIPEIRLYEENYRARSIDEFENGTESGSKGRGVVEGSSMGIANQLAALISELDKISKENDKDVLKALKLIENMRRIVKNTSDPQLAIEQMAQVGDKLRSLFVQISSRDISGLIIRALERLPHEITSRERYSRIAETRERQELIISSIKSSLDDTVSKIDELLIDLEELEVNESYEVTRMTGMKAIFVYFFDIFGIWCASLIIDFLPFTFLLILLIEKQFLNRREMAIHRLVTQSVGDVIDGQIGGDSIKHGLPSKNDIDEIRDKRLGRKDEEKDGKGKDHDNT